MRGIPNANALDYPAKKFQTGEITLPEKLDVTFRFFYSKKRPCLAKISPIIKNSFMRLQEQNTDFYVVNVHRMLLLLLEHKRSFKFAFYIILPRKLK